MIYFYKFCRAVIEFDLAIARSTGRDPQHISKLEGEWDAYDLLILKLEINK